MTPKGPAVKVSVKAFGNSRRFKFNVKYFGSNILYSPVCPIKAGLPIIWVIPRSTSFFIFICRANSFKVSMIYPPLSGGKGQAFDMPLLHSSYLHLFYQWNDYLKISEKNSAH